MKELARWCNLGKLRSLVWKAGALPLHHARASQEVTRALRNVKRARRFEASLLSRAGLSGDAVHKGAVQPGEHAAIIDRAL